MDDRLKVLFLCTGNSCRSQMAEGWARHLKADVVEPYSAGVETHGLDPLAVRVMAEAGVDISHHRSKNVSELMDVPFDVVVTVCGAAHESCPMFPGDARVVHVGFDDPPKLAEAAKDEEEALGCYRRVRDEIRAFVEALPDSLTQPDRPNGGQGVERDEAIRRSVRDAYGKRARDNRSCIEHTCCGEETTADSFAAALGYGEDEFAELPEGANLGLSCGNPTAVASLRPGETVLDLGSGGGFDVFIAARKVGAAGRSIGVDMTPDMVEKARANAKSFKGATGLSNVDFRLGEIEHLPVADSSVDVVISNCVLNLSPDKHQVWREIARVLKPGGRAAISDLALLRPLPKAVRKSVRALVGCIAGAALVDDMREMVRAAGLVDAVFESSSRYTDRLAEGDDELFAEISQKLPPGTQPSDFVTSLNVTAKKADTVTGV